MICLKKKKKNPPSPNPRAFFGRELKKTVCTESLASYVTSGTIWFCVCVCVFYYCTRDLGRVTVNTRLVNSHQQEQTGWCLFAFLPRLFLSVLQCVISCMCLRNIYYLTLQVFTIPQLKLALKRSSSFVSIEKPPFWTACKPTAVSHLWVPLAKDSRDYDL